MTLDLQSLITFSALIGAIVALYKYFSEVVRYIDRQKLQEEEIQKIKEEQTVIVYGLLACLKGLSEQGCDGPVHEAIDKLEKHLNLKAHQ